MAILHRLPGEVTRAHEVSKALGIHRKLGWQIANVVYQPDLFLAGHHVPTAVPLSRFLAAAELRGVEPTLIDTARAAMRDFDRLTRVHAGDRESLNMLLTACASDGAQKADLAQRQAMFNSGSYIWGMQAQVHVVALLMQPSAQDGLFDVTRLRGFRNFRRTRQNVPHVLFRTKGTDDDWTERRPDAREPLGGTESLGAAGGVPLLTEFCSQPLPKFRRRRGAHGFFEDELVETPIGNRGAMTFYMAEVSRNAATRYQDEHNEIAEFGVQLRTPVERLIFDQFVHQDLFGPTERELRVYGELGGPDMRDDRDRLRVFESVTHLGQGVQVARTPLVPQYAEMVQSMFDRLGWAADRFDVFRVQMQYPPIPTSVCAWQRLPPRP
ncbi:MAG: hypothetical protein PVJ57_02820 [Phycisphaerae bacterium]